MMTAICDLVCDCNHKEMPEELCTAFVIHSDPWQILIETPDHPDFNNDGRIQIEFRPEADPPGWYLSVWDSTQEEPVHTMRLNGLPPVDTVIEVCPFCGVEVELTAKWERQPCPNCGKKIAPCSFCRDHHECSNDCYCGPDEEEEPIPCPDCGDTSPKIWGIDRDTEGRRGIRCTACGIVFKEGTK